MEVGDPHVRAEPFVSAPDVHKNTEPKYHVVLLRAVADAKRSAQGPRQILIFESLDLIIGKTGSLALAIDFCSTSIKKRLGCKQPNISFAFADD